MARRIWFFCNAGPQEGLGHFFRCYNYARLAMGPGAEVTFCGDYSPFAASILQEAGFASARLTLPDLIAGQCDADMLVVDTYRKNDTDIAALCSMARAVFIDDFGASAFEGAEAVVNFTVGAARFPYRARNVFTGPGYFPFRRELMAVRERNLTYPKRPVLSGASVLLFLSGVSMPEEVTSGLAGCIDRIYTRSSIAVLGSVPATPLSGTGGNRIAYIQPTHRIEELYAQADTVFSGGGLAKYEAAFCGIPNFTLSITDRLVEETRGFAQRGLTVSLGHLDGMECGPLREAVAEASRDEGFSDRLIRASVATFGLSQIQRFINLLNGGDQEALPTALP